jgi:hypothetical protein
MERKTRFSSVTARLALVTLAIAAISIVFGSREGPRLAQASLRSASGPVDGSKVWPRGIAMESNIQISARALEHEDPMEAA